MDLDNIVKNISVFALAGALSLGSFGCDKNEEYVPATVKYETGKVVKNPSVSNYSALPYVIGIETKKGKEYEMAMYSEGIYGKSLKELEKEIEKGTKIKLPKEEIMKYSKGKDNFLGTKEIEILN